MRNDIRDGLEEQLIKMRKRLLGEFDSTYESLSEIVIKPGDTTSLPTDAADADVEGLEVEVALFRNEESLLEQVEEAMERLKLDTYGTCLDCGQAIDAERLQAIPYAARCIDCARGQRDKIKRSARNDLRRWR
jgi:DnaK suppressor protein